MPATLPDTATCLTCGYALRGLPENVCPECGRAFDPADPRTYRPTEKLPWWHGWTDPPPWYSRAAMLAIAIMLLIGNSSPGLAGSPFSLAVLGCNCMIFICALVAIGDYALRLVATAAARSSDPATRPKNRSGRRAWAVIPICLGVIVSAIFTSWPMHVRFAMSRGALEKAAAAFLDGTNTNTGPQWIGLYHVKDVQVGFGGRNSVFFATGWTSFDEIGFLYSPNRARTSSRWFDLRPPWFLEET